MAFATVDWSSLAEVTSAKLAQMMANDQFLKDRSDGAGFGRLAHTSRTTGLTTSLGTYQTALTLSNVPIQASRLIKISCTWLSIACTGGTSAFIVAILEDGAVKGEVASVATTGVGLDNGGSLFVLTTPAAGNHTYTLGFRRENGTGTGTLEATTNGAMRLLVEDIGPS